MHALSDQILSQHRAKSRLAISAARERRGARTFQLDIAALFSGIQDFAQKERASVPQLRCIPAKLVPGISLGQWVRPLGDCIPRENRQTRFRIERGRVQPKLQGKPMVQLQQFRGHRGGGLAAREKAFKGAGEAVIEIELRAHAVERFHCFR